MQIKCTRCNGSGQIRGAMQKLVPCDCCKGIGFIEVADEIKVDAAVVNKPTIEHKVVTKKKAAPEQKTVNKEKLSIPVDDIEKELKEILGDKSASPKRSISEIAQEAEKETNFLDSISTLEDDE